MLGKKERFFQLSCSGLIESGSFHENEHLAVTYFVEHGSPKDWKLLHGSDTGQSQYASGTNLFHKQCIWNMPFDVTYQSKNPYGWPQLCVKVTGYNFLGRQVPKGYGSVHIPTTPGTHQRVIYLWMPIPKSLFTGLCGFMSTG